MKTTQFLLLALSWMTIQGAASCSKSGSANQSKLDVAIEQERQSLEKALGNDIPSLSVLIETPDGKYFTSSAGKNGKAITEFTNFRFASNTKNFTAAAILNMLQNGWLSLNDKITANIPGSNIPYVPDNAQWNFPHKNEISIKQLLQHNAGIYDLTNDTSQYHINGATYTDYLLTTQPNHQFTTTEYVSVLTQHNLTYGLPNTVYHYSNTGYSILGEIIGRIYSFHEGKARTYADYVHNKITGATAKVPLAVRFIEDANDQQLPLPYVTGMIRTATNTEITDKENASGNIAEGNGIGCMADLNLYVRSLMKGENVLGSVYVKTMQTTIGPATKPENNNYALGCFYLKNLGYGHNGATTGYLSLMVYDPATDISVIVLLPCWDLSGPGTFEKCLHALNNAGLAARTALGYPGK
jgi:D-alanyl-D-alanine carboxypeptidase